MRMRLECVKLRGGRGDSRVRGNHGMLGFVVS